MTAKEKAKELLDKYIELGKDFTRGISMLEYSKQCALIAVDEIINTNALSEMLDYGIDKTNLFYWQEVKHEIEKL